MLLHAIQDVYLSPELDEVAMRLTERLTRTQPHCSRKSLEGSHDS